VRWSQPKFRKVTKRNFSLNFLGIENNKIYEAGIVSGRLVLKPVSATYFQLRSLDLKTRKNRYVEPSFSFSRIPDLTESRMHDGYFQSWKYFDFCQEAIRNFVMSGLSKSVDVAKSPGNYPLFHMRFGDMLTNPSIRQYHGVMSIDYFSEACRLLLNKEMACAKVVTDDADSAKVYVNELSSRFPEFEFEILTGGSQLEDLLAMSNSRCLITSNSSYSWWGAFLSNSQYVISPKLWFSETTLKSVLVEDIYRDNWIRI
jgi:hypothetical protein